jgi:hypothetical protein
MSRSAGVVDGLLAGRSRLASLLGSGAGRPGQRWAVRATAVALVLLALALGVRDARDDRPASPAGVQRDAPSSAPPAPAEQQDRTPGDDG